MTRSHDHVIVSSCCNSPLSRPRATINKGLNQNHHPILLAKVGFHYLRIRGPTIHQPMPPAHRIKQISPLVWILSWENALRAHLNHFVLQVQACTLVIPNLYLKSQFSYHNVRSPTSQTTGNVTSDTSSEIVGESINHILSAQCSSTPQRTHC